MTKENSHLHSLPRDVRDLLNSSLVTKGIWKTLSPLGKNEWICWVISAKKSETRTKRMRIMAEQLRKGKRRPCCWAGCPHRQHQGNKK